MATKPAAPTAPPPPHPNEIRIDLSPSPEAPQGLALRTRAEELEVVDKQTHEDCLLFLRGAKQVKRTIEDRWTRVKRSLDSFKRDIMDQERREIEPVDDAIRMATNEAMAYKEKEDRRVREEQDRLRREEEEKARIRRERDLADAEAAALKAEKDSPILSARERDFVDTYAYGNNSAEVSARHAGFKNPADAARRLLDTPKIQDAIHATQKAAEIRRQAEATRQRPLDVKTHTVTSQVAKVAGVRNTTNYSCDPIIDEAKLRAAYLAGEVDPRCFTPNLVFLNDAARQLTTEFPAAYPGCSLLKKTGIAG
jgi:hypothetical protein